MRGFLGGVSMGALVAAGGAAMLSLSMPLPKVVDVSVEVAAQHAPETGLTADGGTATPVAVSGPDADLVEAAPAAPMGESLDDLSALQGADTQPAERPEVGAVNTAALGNAEAGSLGDIPEIAAQNDGPVLPSAVASSPSAPEQETEIVVSSSAAPPAASVLEPLQNAPDIGAVADVDNQTAPIASASSQASPTHSVPMVPAPQAETAPPNMIAPVVATPQVATEVPAMTAPKIGSMPAASLPTILPTVEAAPALIAEAGVDPVPENNADPSQDAVAALPTTLTLQDSSKPSFGTPVVPLTERNESVETAGSDQDLRPFEAYAVGFENAQNRPLMSIVLIDDAKSIGAEALVGFPYPLSFAIDPEDPKAAEKMTARRAAGFEVLVLADLPREAAPQDAETALEVWFATLPESIGVLEGTKTGFQGNRPLADQVSAAVAASGRGLLTQDKGLNTVQKLAARDGVPAAVVFRDFDGAGQTPRAIRRFLDQAAFRAGQEGAVIMLGRVRPDTISALLLWGLQDRAARVALAPASASLSQQSRDR